MWRKWDPTSGTPRASANYLVWPTPLGDGYTLPERVSVAVARPKSAVLRGSANTLDAIHLSCASNNLLVWPHQLISSVPVRANLPSGDLQIGRLFVALDLPTLTFLLFSMHGMRAELSYFLPDLMPRIDRYTTLLRSRVTPGWRCLDPCFCSRRSANQTAPPTSPVTRKTSP